MFTGADDGDDGPFSLPGANNWIDFTEWVESKDNYPCLKSLVKEGECEDTTKLSEELEECKKEDAPYDVEIMLEHLLDLVGVGHSGEVATISE